MAVRLINLHRHPLRVDLRGGGVLLLAAGQRSDALLEELLYDNCHLPGWERAGWIARVSARRDEVPGETAGAGAPAASSPPAAATAATPDGSDRPPAAGADEAAPEKQAVEAPDASTRRKR